MLFIKFNKCAFLGLLAAFILLVKFDEVFTMTVNNDKQHKSLLDTSVQNKINFNKLIYILKSKILNKTFKDEVKIHTIMKLAIQLMRLKVKMEKERQYWHLRQG